MNQRPTNRETRGLHNPNKYRDNSKKHSDQRRTEGGNNVRNKKNNSNQVKYKNKINKKEGFFDKCKRICVEVFTPIEQKPQISKQERVYSFDYTLLVSVLFLFIFGLVMLYSMSYHQASMEETSSFHYLKRQIFYGLIGGTAIFILSYVPYWLSRKYAVIYYISSLCSLFLVLTSIGKEVNYARRWIVLPGIGQIQPSEFMKIGIVLIIATLICYMKKYKSHIIIDFILLMPGIIASLIIWKVTDNLSTAIIVAGINFFMVSLNSVNGKVYMLVVAIGALFLLTVIYMWGGDFLPYMKGFRAERLLVWSQPEVYSEDGGYQVLQALYAIGSGGLFGKGLGNGTQKLGNIPEIQNDMIFAAICEELGLIGVGIILFLFAIVLYRLYIIAQNAPNLYASMVVAGIFFHIALQVILNISVVTALLPNTGVTLPFISYGGSALVILFVEIGIVLGISRQ